MAKLIIHAGMGKTGTGAIQVSLLKNKEALAEQNIVFFESNQPKPDSSAKHRLMWRNYKSPRWKELRKEAAKYARSEKTVVISNETLWKKDKSELKFLKKIFKGFDCTVLFYVREQVEFLESRALQAMKGARKSMKLDFSDPSNPRGLEKFFEKFDPYLDYLEVAERWESVFGKGSMQARMYARDQFPGGSVVGDFYNAIGADSDTFDFSLEMNPSLTVPFAAITTERHKYLPSVESKSEVLDAALRLSKIRRENLPRLISPAKAEEIRNRVRESNRIFCRKYVVNADEFKLRPWEKGEVSDFHVLAKEMEDLISSWPLIGFNDFGPEKLSFGIFQKGWDVNEAASGRTAVQADSIAMLNFRIHMRSKIRLGDKDLKLFLQCSEETVLRSVTVNGQLVGEMDVAHSPIPILGESLGEFDNVEIDLALPEGSTSSLQVTNVHLEEA